MSLLKAWWGGSTQEGEEKESPDTDEGVGDGDKPETDTTDHGVVSNPWVKGFGGELHFSFSVTGYVVMVNAVRYCVQCKWVCQQSQGDGHHYSTDSAKDSELMTP